MIAAPVRSEELLDGLNDEQRHAVTVETPEHVLVAGAGSGKTKVLTARVARLLARGVPASRILALTFTRAAAGEMGARIGGLTFNQGRLPPILTMHAWCYRFLRAHGPKVGLPRDFAVYDSVDSEWVLRDVAVGVPGVKDAAKARVRTLLGNPQVVRLYRERLRASMAVDYELLQEHALKILREHPEVRPNYQHVVVDEFQDTSEEQVALLDSLGAPNRFYVGDPRQSIYAFRGARPDLMDALVQRWSTSSLAMNYRSSAEIVDVANGVWPSNTYAPMVSARGNGHAVMRIDRLANTEGEAIASEIAHLVADGVAPRSIAVLSRRWQTLWSVREALVSAGVPTTYYGEEADPWSEAIARPLVSIMSLVMQPHDVHHAIRLASVLDRTSSGRAMYAEAIRRRCSVLEIAASTMPVMAQLHKIAADSAVTRLGMSPAGILAELAPRFGLRGPEVDALVADAAKHATVDAWFEWWTDRGLLDRADRAADGVQIMSVHAAKGLEWPAVFAAGHTARDFPPDDPESQRLRYVLYTRARDALYLSGDLP